MSENLSGTDTSTDDTPSATDVDTEAQASDTAAPDADAIDTQSAATNEEGAEPQEAEIYDFGDGLEATREQIEEWKSGALMQADYTKKTQALSDERKAFETQRTEFQGKLDVLGEIESELSQLISGDLDEAKMEELRESNTGEYLRQKEQWEERGKTLSKLVEKAQKLRQDVHAANYQKLHSALGWEDADKKGTDLKAIQAYATHKGSTQDEFNSIQVPWVMEAIRDAEELRQLKAKAPEVKKTVLKAPTPKKSETSKTGQKTLAQRMYPNM